MTTRTSDRPIAAEILPALARAEEDGRTVLLEPEVYSILDGAGIATPRRRWVASADEVDSGIAALSGGNGLVVKVVSPDLLHKSDAGGVALCEADARSAREAVERVLREARASAPEARLRGALVCERIAFRPGLGREILAGFRHDPAFGPVVFAGAGGLDTEYLLDALRPERARTVASAAGLDAFEARRLLEGTLVHAAISGALRGSAGVGDGAALADLVAALATLAERLAGFDPPGGAGLAELEVNPFVQALDGRIVALDGLARIHRPASLPAPRPVGELSRLLTPKSAVVIGASSGSVNPGRIIVRNLIAGGGIPKKNISVVHPKAEQIDGCRAVPSLDALLEPPDMAVVSVPADRGADRVVIDIVENRRAKTVTLISGGFAETRAGRAAEDAMRDAIDRAHRSPDGGVLVNGGNCLGIISAPGGYNTFFLPPYKLPFHDAPGQNVASISQSGAYLVSQISTLDRAIRPRYAISFGNQMDVTVSDYLEYLRDDLKIRVFAVYLEGFRRGDGLRFLDIARGIVRDGRHVLLYKAGRSREGRSAASSHTAASVGDYDVCRELVEREGVLACVTLDMFEDYLMTFSFLAEREARGLRVAVVSNAGFECTAAADKLYRLRLAEYSEPTRERLAALLPAGIMDVHNPIDTTPITPTELYAGCVEAVLDDPGVDAVVVAGVPATPHLENLARGEGHGEDIARPSSLPSRLIRIFRSTTKPMVFSVDSGPLYESCVQMMKRAGLPCFRKVDRATRALSAFLSVR